MDYGDPNATQLEYKLEGEDNNWVKRETGERSFIRYSNLRENTYRLLVRGANSDGYWGEVEEKLLITIRPPLFRQFWFRLLVLFVISSAIYFNQGWSLNTMASIYVVWFSTLDSYTST